MTRLMEDLPVWVQESLRDLRNEMADEGWALGTQASPEQWMTYYSRLPTEAAEFMVEHLLELAQEGSACRQAQHTQALGNVWEQLRGVVQMHNDRVDEVATLRRRVAELEGRPVTDDERLPSERARERFSEAMEAVVGGQTPARLYVVPPKAEPSEQ